MYFKINPTGCGESKGATEVRFDCFLDPGEYRYSEYFLEFVYIPEGGYPGELNKDGTPVSQKDYDIWYGGLSHFWINTEFCSHFVQFDPLVTDAEILSTGEKVLAMAYENWCKGDLSKNKNLTNAYTTDPAKIAASQVRAIQVKLTDFKALKVR